MINIIQLCEDNNIPYRTEGKNTSKGWTQICCPFCAAIDTGFHGGINNDKANYNCWKCGKHPLYKTLSVTLEISTQESKRLIDAYTDKKIQEIRIKEKIINTKIQFPIGTGKLQKIHKQYLLKRNFSYKKLEKEFNLKGTYYLGNYAYRIIAPIYYNGKLISYQGRDVTGKSELRYKACPETEEIIKHKKILYNIDSVTKNKIIICEGITDVWRMGNNCVATFGIGCTKEQIYLLSKYNNVFILFDKDEQAQERAQEVGWTISSLTGIKNNKIEIITGLKSDPAELTNEEAKHLKKELLK